MTARNLQRLIHVGCRELRIEAEDRHALQLMTTGKESLSDMSEAELLKVVGALKDRGFTPHATGKRKPAGRADIRFCHVMWRLLHEAGAVRVGGPAGLNAFVQKRFAKSWGSVPIDIDAMRDWQEIRDVVEALKDWCHREGIELDR